ncbi:hypothetical protein ABVT39_006651 [Epinephelus coioides]
MIMEHCGATAEQQQLMKISTDLSTIATQRQPGQIGGCEIQYPEQVITAQQKKDFKMNVLPANSETLVADFSKKNNYKNSLDNFENSFQTLKTVVASKVAPPPPQELQTRSPISSRHPPTPYSESPKLSSNLRVLKEGISVLEREFIEFREKTLSSLQRSDDSQLVEEMYSTVQHQRYQIDELQQAVRELEEDNRSLRGTLKRVIEELTPAHHSSPTQTPAPGDPTVPTVPTPGDPTVPAPGNPTIPIPGDPG